jgi:DNA-binding response OmpR family regulator
MLADLIILDVEMPDMDGWETIMHLKKNDSTKHIPVIFLSGNSSLEEIKKGLLLGAVDFITKPFQPDELLDRVNSLLYA